MKTDQDNDVSDAQDNITAHSSTQAMRPEVARASPLGQDAEAENVCVCVCVA